MPMVYGGYQGHGKHRGVRVNDRIAACADCGAEWEAGLGVPCHVPCAGDVVTPLTSSPTGTASSGSQDSNTTKRRKS